MASSIGTINRALISKDNYLESAGKHPILNNLTQKGVLEEKTTFKFLNFVNFEQRKTEISILRHHQFLEGQRQWHY
jgi:hypothetical protein